MIWFDRVAAILLVAAVSFLLLMPPASRPDDLELKVTAENLAPVGKDQQVVKVTVRWRWHRKPQPWFTKRQDGIGLVFDRERWGMTAKSLRMHAGDPKDLLGRLGEPYSWHRFSVPSGEDGELSFTLVAQGEGISSYKASVLPMRVQYLYVLRGYPGQMAAGWVKAAEGPVEIR